MVIFLLLPEEFQFKSVDFLIPNFNYLSAGFSFYGYIIDMKVLYGKMIRIV